MGFLELQNEEAFVIAFSLTVIVCIVISIAFFVAVRFLKSGDAREYVSYAPTLLTSLGIFGTFAGIVVGLMAFNVNDIDGSIQGLLNGLKTAFFTSLFGIVLSIIFKVLHTSGKFSSPDVGASATSATPEDILNAINQQKGSIDLLVSAIGGNGDSSLLSQMKLLRSEICDNQKLAHSTQQRTLESIILIQDATVEQKQIFADFSDRLWIKMQDFADMLSKSATETVIEALKQVITDFNNNLTEQFGENFKQLNEAVKELVTWQENYKTQISEMTEQYKLGVASINATELSVSKISSESKAIPENMSNLKDIMEVNRHQLAELERHLEAFKDIRDRAVEAVPEIRKNVDETVKTIAESVQAASLHYKELLNESDKFIQSHISSSHDLLDNFISKTNEGVDSIGKKLAESASKVESVITKSADEFSDSVSRVNGGLQDSASHVSEQTEVIKNHLKDTVEDLNEHVRSMIHSLVNESKALSSTLTDANKALVSDTSSVRDTVSQSIEKMQKRLESSLEDVFASQTQHMQKVFSNVDASLRDQVGKTGDVVEKQLSMLDQAMQQELQKVMNVMGTKLGQIANQFVNDYSRLTEQMSIVVRKAG